MWKSTAKPDEEANTHDSEMCSTLNEGGTKELSFDISKASHQEIHRNLKEELWKHSQLLIDQKNAEKEIKN